MKCTHNKDWHISEDATGVCQHDFHNGELSHYNGVGELTGMATFECRECGLTIRFNTAKPPRQFLANKMRQIVLS